MSSVFVESVGLFAPGMEGWAEGSGVLAGRTRYHPRALSKYKPRSLPPNERRRTTDVVRLAFGACEDAIGERWEEAAGLASVFAASGGDFKVNDQLCRVLAGEQRMLSPTQFHNSVHNAAAGYWSIATRSQEPSVSLSAFDFSVAAGLVEAAGLVVGEARQVLLGVYDNSVGWPMRAKRDVSQPFGAALWLTPGPGPQALARIDIEPAAADWEESVSADPDLEALRCCNPAARLIPLLELLAARGDGELGLAAPGGQGLRLTVAAC